MFGLIILTDNKLCILSYGTFGITDLAFPEWVFAVIVALRSKSVQSQFP